MESNGYTKANIRLCSAYANMVDDETGLYEYARSPFHVPADHIQAAMGVTQLKELDDYIAAKRCEEVVHSWED